MHFKTIGEKEGLFELVEIPEKFGPLSYPVDDHKIKTYAFTQDDYNPWYFTEDNPFGKRIAHSSILANDLLSLFLTKYNPNTIVGLHTQEELWFHSPVYAGETVTLEGVYVDKYEKRNKGYVVMEAEARGEDGRVLVKHRGIEIMRIHGGSVAAKRTANVEGDVVTGEYDKSIPAAKKATEDIAIGTPIAPLVKHTSAEQSAVYSWIGKYFENIHNNINKAKIAGFDKPVVQGQQQVGYATEFLTNFFGTSWFTSGWEKIKMIRPVLVDEVITVRGVVKDKTVEDGKTKLHLHIWIENEQGEMTIIGWAHAFVGK
ncbi:MaoC family dehydratase [Bacillus litorisediminis]|uniref:MaoC family dehydratase n=1 Tax=Bacillus litorisediminis TaxID=2922713 RepID=UPI001FAC052E|nr:MaoC family dehydratase [Bacillus litorisediminis]